jgi:hypothetical protein
LGGYQNPVFACSGAHQIHPAQEHDKRDNADANRRPYGQTQPFQGGNNPGNYGTEDSYTYPEQAGDNKKATEYEF